MSSAEVSLILDVVMLIADAVIVSIKNISPKSIFLFMGITKEGKSGKIYTSSIIKTR